MLLCLPREESLNLEPDDDAQPPDVPPSLLYIFDMGTLSTPEASRHAVLATPHKFAV